MLRAKPIPLCLHISKGSLREGAPDEVRRGRVRYNEVSTNLKPRRLLSSRYACHLPLGGRLSASLIITQIGRENKFSAEILCACHFSAKNAERISESFFVLERFKYTVRGSLIVCYRNIVYLRYTEQSLYVGVVRLCGERVGEEYNDIYLPNGNS